MYSSEEAVSVVNVNKTYGNGKYSLQILRNFNMTVKKGTIYGLLGSSGCGKTTILSSILGVKKVDSGKILVGGRSPRTKGNGFPGKQVGYMPQEIALIGDFSIAETLEYFGTLYGMNKILLKINSKFLIDLLKLPSSSRRINALSGGQQRRVSFAVALIHNPELLILDEPTVGVDPLLRKSIWEHLVSLTSSGKTTVIITTHYIEEARQSNTVGLMRNGSLLTESSPETLLQLHCTNTLEEVVLKLCLQNDYGKNGPPGEHTMSASSTFNPNSLFRRIGKGDGSNIQGLTYRKRNPDLWDIEICRKWNDYQKRNEISEGESKRLGSSTLRNWKESLQRLKSLCAKNTLSVTRNLT